MANYLYNGIELPALPNWDKTVYPYAMLRSYRTVVSFNPITYAQKYDLYVLSVRPYKRTDYDNLGVGTGTLRSVICSDGVWGEFGDEVGIDITWYGYIPFWTNTDILNEDGTLYLSATTPISLANQTVIEWDGDTTDLQSTTRTFTVSENTETLTFYKVSDAVPSVKQVEGGYYVTYYYNAGTRYDGKNINYLTSDGFVVSGGTDDTFCNPFVLVNSEGVWLSKTEYADNADGDHYTSVATYATVVADIDPVAFMTGWQLGKAIRSLLQ